MRRPIRVTHMHPPPHLKNWQFVQARLKSARHRIYEVLEHGPVGDRTMRLVSRLLILLVLANISAVVLES
jgi:hypothetical protein